MWTLVKLQKKYISIAVYSRKSLLFYNGKSPVLKCECHV